MTQQTPPRASDPDRTEVMPGARAPLRPSSDSARTPASPGGPRIGRFAIRAELGRGGMGVVYQAHDPALARDVAIKVVHDVAADREGVERFVREARVCARLRHHGIVSVIEAGVQAEGDVHPRMPFIVMDFVRGESLDEALRRGPMPPRRIASVVLEVALALQHAHDHGVIHRDVKPQNILLDAEAEQARLSDFGLARDENAKREITLTGDILGTPAYMSPEQADGSACGPPTDVWALGAVLYRALAGRTPFSGETAMVTIQNVLFTDPVPPSRIAEGVHVDLETIALRCLEKEAARRYASAAEVADELRRFLAGEPIAARPIGRRERAGRWVRRHRLATGGAGLALAVAVAALAGGVLAHRASIRSAAATEAREAVDALRATRLDGAGFDDRLGAGLEALDRASRLLALDPHDPAARDLAFETAMQLGDDALGEGYWSVARRAFAIARATRSERPEPPARLARLAARRERFEETVVRVLEDARTDELARRASGYEQALALLVSHRSPFAVRRVAEALGEVTVELRRAVEGIDPAFIAERDRASFRMIDFFGGGSTDWRDERAVLADVQRRVAGAEMLVLARLCCEALGRMGIAEGAIAPLAEFVRTVEDEVLAAAAGEALCLLGDASAGRVVVESLARFGDRGPFWRRVGAALARSDLTLPVVEGDAESHLRRALLRRAAGRLEGAFDDLEEAVRIDSENAAIHRAHGEVLLERGSGRALAAFDRAVELAPEDARAWTGLGAARLAAGDREGAGDALETATDLDPWLARAWSTKAILFARAGNVDDGIIVGRRATDIAPYDVETWVVLSQLYLAWSKDWRAREQGVTRKAIEQAIDAASRAIEVDPRSAEAWSARAHAYAATNDAWDTVHNDLSRALELDPMRVDDLRLRGNVRGALLWMHGAAGDLERVVALEPHNRDARLLLGRARLAAGEPEAAILEFTRAIELDETHAMEWNLRGTTRLVIGELVEAVEDLRRACALEPTNPIYASDLAHALLASGDDVAAMRSLDEAIETATAGDRSKHPLAFVLWHRRGLVHLARGAREAALTDLSEAIARAPAGPKATDAFVDRGRLHLERGDLDAAFADFEAAEARSRHDARTHEGQAEVLVLRGETDAAIRDLATFLRTRPLDPGAPRLRKRLEELRASRER